MWIRKWMILLLCLAAAAKAEFSADAIDVNDPDRKQAFQLYNNITCPRRRTSWRRSLPNIRLMWPRKKPLVSRL